MINISDLPIHDCNIEMLKSLNDAYFHNKGKFLYASPVGTGTTYLRELGYELYAQIRVHNAPEHLFEFSVFINEKMTAAEIQDALSEFAEITTGYEYDVL